MKVVKVCNICGYEDTNNDIKQGGQCTVCGGMMLPTGRKINQAKIDKRDDIGLDFEPPQHDFEDDLYYMMDPDMGIEDD